MQNKIQHFDNKSVTFVEALNVKEGVVCDVYLFDDSKEKDLGIISVSPNTCTPLQRILKGKKTIEGLLQGKGVLTVTGANGKVVEYTFDKDEKEIELHIGDTMQWCSTDSELVFYEICYLPYKDGRYENINP